jgi:hypothetical protein
MARAPRAAATVASAPAPAPADAAPAPAPAPAPVPAPEAPVAASSVPADLFDTAFSEAIAAEVDAGPTEPASAAVPKKPPEAAVPASEAASKPAESPAPTATQPPESTPAEPPAPAPTPQPPPQAEAQPQPPLQPQPQPQPQQYQEPPLFNAEEVTQLQQFYTDWPDVARATETMVKGIMTQTVRRMYADMAASLSPYLQTVDTLADRSQLSELHEHVSDYDTVASQLTTWAAKQPAYLRSAYEHVIKSGTAAEVVDLINRYKQDMQSTAPAHSGVPGSQPAPAVSATAAPVPSPAPAPVNPALAAAAARLAPVSTKRTNVVAPPTDFDSAFAEFARAS